MLTPNQTVPSLLRPFAARSTSSLVGKRSLSPRTGASLPSVAEYLEKKAAGRVKVDGAYVQFLSNHGSLEYNMKRFPEAFSA